ncbi:hypothetical protein DesyoDRAFT_5409 [Desulfosporosinus youngiae DSM 17734]|uniref:Uncharacterized protein n=1 Tax=Desulfosporosinus youngiae DSM 17734 TaxID=768710 RepID=H5Y0S8_9FIRM|nr:hypothetical protein DesyoDRAFT_5409 [Desulfosporosinus youngiae DSM 17734]
MSKKELCFYSWHGEPGKRKHFLSNYCKEGFHYDSKTDKRLDLPICQDWFGDWSGGCCDLKERKTRGSWVPRRRNII